MRIGMPGLLLYKRLYGRFHLRVFDERFRLFDNLNGPMLPGRQQQMHHVHHVGGKRVSGNPVQRGVGPVEATFRRCVG